jgi:hypothetical protein
MHSVDQGSTTGRAGRRLMWVVAALAAAALLLESTLTRLLAVGQFYHFAFLVVSLALLGFGASGTFLALRASSSRNNDVIQLAGVAFAAATVLAYAVVNWLPFDSYSIAWERRQILYFVLYYLALTLPFFCSGVGIGAALAAGGERSHLIYAANLLGSGVGVLLAPAALAVGGVPGAVLASALVGLAATLVYPAEGPSSRGRSCGRWAGLAILLAGGAALAGLGALNGQGRAPLGLTISPYKGLAYALRYPGATRIFGQWNAISRADVVASAGTRLLPGLSYTYNGSPPVQAGLSLDAESMEPITLVAPEDFVAADYLPEALAFRLRPAARMLVLEPGGGLGVVQALATYPSLGGQAPSLLEGEGRSGAQSRVTAVVGNALVPAAVARGAPAANVYADPRVQTVVESPRGFLRRERSTYDLVFLPLTDPYRPVTSGAYSLGETYSLTVEAFADALARLAPDGVLVVTRWLQTPPSESLRLIATLVEALERRGTASPAEKLVAYRGIQTITVLVQPDGWSAEELAQVREFAAMRRYDLVWAPDVRADEVNRFNRLPEPADYRAVQELVSAENRAAFYAAYPFDVAPATDNHPFFFHFFKWQQAPEVLATLGRTWQPFGGSGYFILWALLALVLVLSAILIVAPLAFGSGLTDVERPVRIRALVYFAMLGAAFLFVEIPLIQRWILLLGHPTYAFTAVVLSLLLCSSLGSALARAGWLPRRTAFGLLVLLAIVAPVLATRLTEAALGWPLWARLAIAVAGLAPLGVLMGLPFPLGLAWLEGRAPRLIPWAWAVNGSASVVASVLAAILALSYGFTAVLLLGAGCYAAAWAVLFLRGGDLSGF